VQSAIASTCTGDDARHNDGDIMNIDAVKELLAK
jgi:hypothetical protein